MRQRGPTLCLGVGALALLLSCGTGDIADRRTVDLSERHTEGPTVGAPDLDATEVTLAELPAELRAAMSGDGVSVLLGDVAGTRADEIILVGGETIAVLSLEGRVLRTIRSLAGPMTAGVLLDHDGDGKLDVVTGAGPGSDPVIRVYNGTGKLLTSRRLFDGTAAFSCLCPAGLLEGDVIVLAVENWPAGSRGVFRLDGSDMSTRWFSAIPTAVRGVAVIGRRIAVSNDVQSHGEFLTIGTGDERRFGFDATPQVVLLGPRGQPVVERELPLPPHAESAPAWLLAAGDSKALLHEEAYQRISIVDVRDGRPAAARLLPEGEALILAQLMTFPGSPALGAAVVMEDATGWLVVLYGDRLAELQRWSGSGQAPRLVAAVEAEGGRSRDDDAGAGGPGLLAARSGEVILLRGDTITRRGVGFPDGSVDFLASVGETGVVLIIVGDSLSVVRIPFLSGATGK